MSITAQPARRTPARSHPVPVHRAFLPLLLVLALLGLAGCSAGTDDSRQAAGGADAAGPQVADGGTEAVGADAPHEDGLQDPPATAGQALAPGTAKVTGGEGGEAPLMVRTVTMEVLVDDVLAAAGRARAAAIAVDGWVSSEDVRPASGDGPAGTAGWATLVLRVPSEDLDGVLTGLGELGEVTSSRSSAEDVTAEYRDVEARVATLEASAQRLRDLIEEAGSVESIAGLERELASREADLDGLKARMKALGEDISRSTVTLHLAEDEAALAQAAPATGFLAGLHQGWDAFAASVTVLLTALGAVLPFAVVLALAGVPVLLWRRRSRSSGSRSSGSRTAAPAAGSD
jgi:hypothetical protein